MLFLGITRGNRFSPNMATNDMAIMRTVANELTAQGHQVELTDEYEWASREDSSFPDAVFTMMRSEEALLKLDLWEQLGIRTLNSVEGIRNADRKRITRIMQSNDIPMPATVILPSESLDGITCPCWVKRGDGWAEQKEDVTFATDQKDASRCVDRLLSHQSEATVVVSEHLKGDLVKFYGVAGTDFFYWYYPNPEKSKFGLEKVNGSPAHHPFNTSQLKAVGDHVARCSRILVYGGDCIVGPDGFFGIIDFNDWPSFSSCRPEAAKAVAQLLLRSE